MKAEVVGLGVWSGKAAVAQALPVGMAEDLIPAQWGV